MALLGNGYQPSPFQGILGQPAGAYNVPAPAKGGLGSFDVNSLLSNPLLHAGVALLGSRGPGSAAPAALQGLMQGAQYKTQLEAQQREQAERERKQKALSMIGEQNPALAPYIDAGLGAAVVPKLFEEEKAAPRIMTPEEVARYGFAPGSVVAQTDTGFNVLQKPEAPAAPKPSDVAGLRKEYTAASGDFVKVRDAFGKVQKAAQSPSAQNDLALIFNYMKMLDPGSVVREGEFATAQNAAGVDQQIRNMYNRVRSGERLADEQRQGFVRSAGGVFESQLDIQKNLESQFGGIAERLGYDPQNVVYDLFGSYRDYTTAPPATAADGGTRSGRGIGAQMSPVDQARAYLQGAR